MAPSKQAKQAVTVSETRRTGSNKDAQGYWGKTASFSFRRYDADAPWALSRNKKPVVDSVFKNLHGFEQMIWTNIMQASGGRRHGTNNHDIPVSELTRDAIRRAETISLEESELFSLRLQGDVRLWGIIEPENGCFYVIWFDPEHKVYPINRV